ncbi:hypothetical protein EP7_001741 [Isosphaeraceae bacterium EP7]
MGDSNDHLTDLVRWTFASDPGHRAEIEQHLHDLGLDVAVHDESRFCVTWDEPESDRDAVIEALWAINGAPFEVTQEEFHRTSLLILHQDEDDKQAA